MYKIDQKYYSGALHVADEDGNPVLGLTTEDFVIEMFLDGTPYQIAVTINELTNGNYQAEFIPDEPGVYTLIIRQLTYNPAGWAEPPVRVWPYPYGTIPSSSYDSFLISIEPADFRDYFTRDFKYLKPFSLTKEYFEDDIVSYQVGNDVNFYKMLLTSSQGVIPTEVTDPPTWEAVNVDVDNYVLDMDIQKGFGKALTLINPELFENGQVLVEAYLYLTAHYMVKDLRLAGSGIDSKGESIASSQSVGSVSVSFSVPEHFSSNPMWGELATTGYGRMYIAYVWPRIQGKPGIARGRTLP